MNNRQFAQVGLGLLGVWAFLTAVIALIQIIGFLGVSGTPLALAQIVPMGLLSGVSYVLVFHNAKVAMAIFPDLDGATETAGPHAARTLVALTGVLLLVQAMPGAVNAVLSFLPFGEIDRSLHGPLFRRFVGSLVSIGCGLYLIVRPERLLEFLQRPAHE